MSSPCSPTDLIRLARQALSLMDLTSLNDHDDEARIAQLCAEADTPAGRVAALCIYPRFVPFARRTLDALGLHDVKVATVTNFPHGDAALAPALEETRAALAAGADEIDLVFPYRALMAGDLLSGQRMLEEVRALCGTTPLKVIIESGELGSPERIRQASQIAIAAGADFIKTSTGKVPVNATLDAARIMLECLRDSGARCGFKAAGGVRSSEDAAAYLELAAAIMGPDWITPAHFRFGASGLRAQLLATLAGQHIQPGAGY